MLKTSSRSNRRSAATPDRGQQLLEQELQHVNGNTIAQHVPHAGFRNAESDNIQDSHIKALDVHQILNRGLPTIIDDSIGDMLSTPGCKRWPLVNAVCEEAKRAADVHNHEVLLQIKSRIRLHDCVQCSCHMQVCRRHAIFTWQSWLAALTWRNQHTQGMHCFNGSGQAKGRTMAPCRKPIMKTRSRAWDIPQSAVASFRHSTW